MDMQQGLDLCLTIMFLVMPSLHPSTATTSLKASYCFLKGTSTSKAHQYLYTNIALLGQGAVTNG